MNNQAGWEWVDFELQECQQLEDDLDYDSEIQWRLQQIEILESQGAE